MLACFVVFFHTLNIFEEYIRWVVEALLRAAGLPACQKVCRGQAGQVLWRGARAQQRRAALRSDQHAAGAAPAACKICATLQASCRLAAAMRRPEGGAGSCRSNGFSCQLGLCRELERQEREEREREKEERRRQERSNRCDGRVCRAAVLGGGLRCNKGRGSFLPGRGALDVPSRLACLGPPPPPPPPLRTPPRCPCIFQACCTGVKAPACTEFVPCSAPPLQGRLPRPAGQAPCRGHHQRRHALAGEPVSGPMSCLLLAGRAAGTAAVTQGGRTGGSCLPRLALSCLTLARS